MNSASEKTPDPLVSVKHLSIDYRKPDGEILRVVEDVSFDVSKGGRIALVGPSGCGKTSILRALAGLVPAASGSISYGGALDPEKARANGLFGMVPQHNSLLRWRTASANIALPLEFRQRPKEAIKERVSELLKFFGLESFGGYYPSQLSGGMRSRVAIARALSESPRILLLDECFGDLDELTRERLNRELSPMWNELGTTIVFVTHSIREAVFLADQILVLTPLPASPAGVVTVQAEQPRERDFEATSAALSAANDVRKHLGI